MHRPDIEIYLKDAEYAAVATWLEQVLGPCGPQQEHGQTLKCIARSRRSVVRTTWLSKAVGKWHNLSLESDSTPRGDDLACVRAAYAVLGVEIRCASDGWKGNQDEEDADRWLRVSAGGVEETTWCTA